VTYNGTGKLVLGVLAANTADNSSTFNGNFVVNQGTVSVLKSVNLNSTTQVTSPLGARTNANRSVIIDSGAILSFDSSSGNETGRGGGPTFEQWTNIVNQGGLLRATVGNRTLGPLVLNGGTVGITGPIAPAYQILGLASDVYVVGTSPSFITNTSTAGGVNLTATAGATRTFNVADVTGGNVDLTISAILGNEVGSATAASSLTKAGPGTMLLAGTNYYTGLNTISAGTLIASNNSPSGGLGALGAGTSPIILGDANTAVNNSSPALLIGGAFTIGRGILVSNEPTTGTYTIGAKQNTNSAFRGLITIYQPLTISQFADNTGANALTISGGITNAGGNETLTFSGPGNVIVATNGITDGGTLAVNIAGGTNTFSAANVYNGGTTVANAALIVNGSITGSVTGNAGSIIGGSGAISGNVAVNGVTLPGVGGVDGATNTIGGDLTYDTGSAANFDLGDNASAGGNDQIILSGSGTVLTVNGGINVGIICGSHLDTSGHSYVLYNLTGGGSISGSFNATPVWLATTPNFAADYTVVNTGTQIVLQYTGPTGPSINASSTTPNPALRSQAVTISVTVTPGGGAIASVTVDASVIGGSATQGLVSDGVGDYTNTVVVSSGTAPGNKTLNVTVTDVNNFTAAVGIPLSVIGSQEVWEGGAGDNNWTSIANWVSGAGPGLSGDSVTFAGTIRLTPLMDNSYSVGSLTFSSTAGSFNIGASYGNSLTLAGGLTNDSANVETVNVPINLSVPVTVSASSGPVTLGQRVANNGNLLTVSDGGFNTIIDGGLSGSGGLVMNGTGTNAIAGNSSFNGPTTINSGTVALLGTNSPSATVVANGATLQLANSNSVTGTLTLHSGSTLQLRGDYSTTFTNAGISLDNASDTNNFNVNFAAGGTGQTLTLAGTLAYLYNSDQLINVTGNSTYTLDLGDITTTTTTAQGMVFDINAVPDGASVIINSFTSGNYGNYVDMTGGGEITVRGKLANTSNGSDTLFVNNGTTVTLQGPTVVTSNVGNVADGYGYYVQNGTLVVDNSGALTNNTSGSGVKLSQFILGGALFGNASGVGFANNGDTSDLAVTNDNDYNCAIYLGDANFPNGGITVWPTVTNIVSDGGFVVSTFTTFENTGTYTIGGQNTSGTNTFANPIILGYQTVNNGGFDGGKSVTVVATAGGEVDFTGGILQNGGDTTAAVTIGDLDHTGLVKFAGVNDTYPGGTTVAYGQLLVNNTIGTGSSTVTVNSGASLGGDGIILDPLTIQAGGTLYPGLGNGDTSALTINNALTLGGNVTFTLNRANTPNSSQVSGVTALTVEGTLTLTNAGAPLQAGDSFTLFNAGSYTGNFSATNLPALPSGLAWSNDVANSGTISVISMSVPAPPTIGSAKLSEGNIVFSGMNGSPGQQYRILTTTNLLLPMSSWTPVATNIFAPNGGYTNNILVNPAQGSGFFRLVTP
jgi:fibronectin-binding autotransporter adhesin